MIIERLQTLISHYGLTPSSLADSIGVPRSSVSHLLSGRNKPSLDFVLKLIKTYPEVNLYWLLNGKGTFPAERDDHQNVADLNTISREGLSDKTPPPLANRGKSVEKIVVLYQDGTFDTYEPTK
jgi:transcriptional regulator with XRE-family HTH domain